MKLLWKGIFVVVVFFVVVFLMGSSFDTKLDFDKFASFVDRVRADEDHDEEDEEDEEDDEDDEDDEEDDEDEDDKKESETSVDVSRQVRSQLIVDSDGDGILDSEDPHPNVAEIFIVEDNDKNGIVDRYESD